MKKVITYGSFDLFHQGHLNFLRKSKELGDYLIVGVSTAEYSELRGKLNVVDSLETRISNVRNTGLADEIIVENHSGQIIDDIKKYGADILTVGSTWTGQFDAFREFCDVVYIPRTRNVSVTLDRSEKISIIRLGVIGTGRIARRFVEESKFVSGIEIQAVFNPHIDSAKTFADFFELDCFTDDLNEFLRHVDAVYIASPHETHYSYAKYSLMHGKHVLCEKPMALVGKEAAELYKIADEKGLILIEALKTAFCPGFQEMINVAKSGIIGEICDVESCFTRIASPKSRERIDLFYGGAFTEFGSHTLLPIVKLLGTGHTDIRFDSIFDENGLDVYTKVSFKFPGAFAMSKSGVSVKSEGQLIISGTKGYILAKSPWWLTKSFEIRYEDPSIIDKREFQFLGQGLRYEISEFLRMINGENVARKIFPEESIWFANLMEKFMAERKLLHGKI